MPASCSALRTGTRSLASETTSNESPRSLTSSAPASSTAVSTSSSDRPALGDEHDALAVEHVGHRAGVGQRAAVAGQRDAHLGGRAVAVVGEALDQHRDAAGRVALVHDGLPVGAAGLQAAAALAGALDVVDWAPSSSCALLMASKSVGLPSGSGPPVRAATSMFLMSLANSLPRLASSAAFLCFVVAHLEWPDIA